MAYGVTDQGFALKRLADILSDMRTRLSAIEDPVTGETLSPDLADENDPLAQIVNAVADELSACWEQLQLAYNQFDPLKGTGAGLSGTVQLNKIKRLAGSSTLVTLTMTGTPNLFIAAGKQAALYDGSVVFDLPEWTFDGSGQATVVGTCTEEGPTEATAGSVTSILTPVRGWTACTNAADAVPGRAPETDAQLRSRQRQSTETTGRTTIGDIYGNLANIEGVTFCRVYQNQTLSADSRGIPAKSVAAVVVGGDDTEVAETLFRQSPPGIGLHGSTSVNVTDEQGIQYAVAFTRPTAVPVYVAISLTVVNSSFWPTDGEDQIKDAILAYAQSGAYGLGITSGFDQDGYTPGQSVYASELFTPVNSIPGTRITALTIGTTASPADQSVAIDWDEVAEFDADNIDITVS